MMTFAILPWVDLTCLKCLPKAIDKTLSITSHIDPCRSLHQLCVNFDGLIYHLISLQYTYSTSIHRLAPQLIINLQLHITTDVIPVTYLDRNLNIETILVNTFTLVCDLKNTYITFINWIELLWPNYYARFVPTYVYNLITRSLTQ